MARAVSPFRMDSVATNPRRRLLLGEGASWTRHVLMYSGVQAAMAVLQRSQIVWRDLEEDVAVVVMGGGGGERVVLAIVVR